MWCVAFWRRHNNTSHFSPSWTTIQYVAKQVTPKQNSILAHVIIRNKVLPLAVTNLPQLLSYLAQSRQSKDGNMKHNTGRINFSTSNYHIILILHLLFFPNEKLKPNFQSQVYSCISTWMKHEHICLKLLILCDHRLRFHYFFS